MKKLIIGASSAALLAITVTSPASANVPRPISDQPCTIAVPSKIGVSDTYRVARNDRFDLSISCVSGITVNEDNFYNSDRNGVVDAQQWTFVGSRYATGENDEPYVGVNLAIPDEKIDPLTGEVLGNLKDESYGQIQPQTEFSSSKYSKLGIYLYAFGTYNLFDSGEYQNYLAYNDGDVTTLYPLKLSNPIVRKYESTVGVKAKKSGSSVTLKVAVNRNRSSETKGGKPGSAYGIIKSYSGDKVTIYRDGKKIATKKVPSGGKLTVKLYGQSGKHTYKVVLPENSVNFEGTGSITK